MPIFWVQVERTESCTFAVEGPSLELVKQAVEEDEWSNYFFEESKNVYVSDVPAKLREKTKAEAHVVQEADGSVEILDPDQYKAKYPKPEDLPEPPSPPDTQTLPLFAEEQR